MVKNSTQDYIERSCLRKEKIILNNQSSTDISFFPQNEIMMSALALCLPCLSEKVLCCFSLWRDKLQLVSLYGPGDFIDQEACWSSWCYFSTNLRSDGEKKVRIKASWPLQSYIPQCFDSSCQLPMVWDPDYQTIFYHNAVNQSKPSYDMWKPNTPPHPEVV